MSDTAPKPEGTPWLSPYLAVADVDKAVEFYQNAYGFQLERLLEGQDGRAAHATLSYHDARVMVGLADQSHVRTLDAPLGQTPDTLHGSSIVLYLFTEDVDAVHKRAVEAGAREGYPPEDMFWGDRVCLVFDLDGHGWNFATHQFDYPPAD